MFSIHLCAVRVRLFVANLSVWFSGYPYLFSASKANAIVFPFAIPIFATSAHRHCCHLLAAIGTKVCKFSCVRTLPTVVSCKRHPHTTVRTLWRVIIIHFPLSHSRYCPFVLRRSKNHCLLHFVLHQSYKTAGVDVYNPFHCICACNPDT